MIVVKEWHTTERINVNICVKLNDSYEQLWQKQSDDLPVLQQLLTHACKLLGLHAFAHISQVHNGFPQLFAQLPLTVSSKPVKINAIIVLVLSYAVVETRGLLNELNNTADNRHNEKKTTLFAMPFMWNNANDVNRR